MDDRVARALLEDNILVRQKRAEADIALLQKLATNPSVVLEELPIPGETESPASNALHWQNVFLFDEFVSLLSTTFSNNTTPLSFGQLGWMSGSDTEVALYGLTPYSVEEHYGVASVTNLSGTDGVVWLAPLYFTMVRLMQFIVLFTPLIDAGDGYAIGVMDTSGAFSVDGTALGVYFKCEYGDTNWFAVTNDASTTSTDTGVAFADSIWYLFEIKQPTAGVVEFYINQTLVATHTTNIPTADDISPIVGNKDPGSSNVIGFALDYFAMQLAPMIQRWD